MKELLLSAIKVSLFFLGSLWGAFVALDSFVNNKVEAGIQEVKEIRKADMEHLDKRLQTIESLQRDTINIISRRNRAVR